MTLVDDLSIATGFSKADVTKILATASHRYKVYRVPKRSGRGFRVIEQPASEVKLLQRWVVRHVIRVLPRHQAVTAYEKGSSIFQNASRHAKNKYVLKLDFQNFFPSIRAGDFLQHLGKYSRANFSEFELDLLCRLLFRKAQGELRLTIGAPSSPSVANTILYDFDSHLGGQCASKNVEYTRYADDLAFSARSPAPLIEIRAFVAGQLRQLDYPKLTLNEAKTVLISPKFRRTVTGLVLTTNGEVSLGRERKRQISAGIHRFALGQLDQETTNSLIGMLAFAWSVEEDFLHRMAAKYGESTMSRLFPKALSLYDRANAPGQDGR
jgi:RNA-directed DNA polymerase